MNAQKILFGIGLLVISFSGKAQSWNQVTVPTQANLNDIEFVNDQVGYIAGDSLTILKTTDGGGNWTSISHQGLPTQGFTLNIQEIEFVSETIGYLTIENQGWMYKTTDGGLNWTQVQNNQTNQCFPVSIYLLAEDDLFVGGADCFQGMTINQYQGGIWNNQQVNAINFDSSKKVVDIEFDGNLGLAAVNNEYILRSTNAGVTWDSINTNIGTGNELTSVLIANNDTCYAGYNQNGGGFGILYSTDAGLTWQEDLNSATFFYPAYYGGTMNSDGKVYMTAVSSSVSVGLIFDRNGTNWGYESVDQPVYAMDSYGNDVTWAVGDSGYVVVNKALPTLSIDSNLPETSNGFMNLYPNPTSGNLFWDCDDCAQKEVLIFDLHGKVVHEILDATTSNIDLSKLNSGVYIFQLTNEYRTFRTRFIKE